MNLQPYHLSTILEECAEHFHIVLNSSVPFGLNCSGSHLSPLPLSKLPPSCGYTIRTTQRDLVLHAPYDGCFVALQVGYFVLKALHTWTMYTCTLLTCLAGFRMTAMFSHCVGVVYQWRCHALRWASLHLTLQWSPATLREWSSKRIGPSLLLKLK